MNKSNETLLPDIIRDFPRLSPDVVQQASQYAASILADVAGLRAGVVGGAEDERQRGGAGYSATAEKEGENGASKSGRISASWSVVTAVAMMPPTEKSMMATRSGLGSASDNLSDRRCR